MNELGQSVRLPSGEQLHVVTSGVGDPPLLLSAGLGGAWYDWLPFTAAAGRQHRVVCFDRPGLGASPERAAVPSLEEEADRLAALADEYAPSGAVLVAHSMAALHAEALARREPDVVRGLVLVDPSCGRPGRLWPASATTVAYRAGAAAVTAGERAGLIAALPALWDVAMRAQTVADELPEPVRDAGRSCYRSARPLIAAWGEWLGYPRMLARLDGLRARTRWPGAPTHIITALGDAPFGERAVRWQRCHGDLARRLGARHRVLPGSRHWVAGDAPAAVLRGVEDVLDGLP